MDEKYLAQRLMLPEYDFLKTDPHLGTNIILLTIAGSVSYGTDVPTSDLDIRGISLELKEDIFGLSHFEHYEDRQTDTVVYGLKKFVRLCLNSNPNTLELLGTESEHLVIMSKEGEQLRQNSNLFLSKKVIDSFGNYAKAQLHRLHNALDHKEFPKTEKDKARTLKHGMHLVRLLIAGTLILEGKPIKTFRAKDRGLLLDIRNGHYTYEEIFALVKDLESDFARAAINTQLPDKPDYKQIQELIISIYQDRLCSK